MMVWMLGFPIFFKVPLCSAVVTDAKEAGVSYAMAKGILDNKLEVDDEAVAAKAEAKPRTVAKP